MKVAGAPSHSRSRRNRSSLHSPPAATTCTSFTCAPSRLQAIVMSAIGESFSSTYRAASNSSGSSPSTSGWHSSMRNTFRPSSALLAGSRKMTPGRNPSSTSATFPGSTLQFRNRTFSTPNSLKFSSVALTNSTCISLYSTSWATCVNAHASTPIPPVKSAILKRSFAGAVWSPNLWPPSAESATFRLEGIPPETCGHPRPHKREGPAACGGRGRAATVSGGIPSSRKPRISDALYRAVSEELHCSPDNLKG